MRKTSIFRFSFLFVLSFFIFTPSAQAAICIWTGADNDADWSNADNWTDCNNDNGNVPGNDDTAIFPSGNDKNVSVNTLSVSTITIQTGYDGAMTIEENQTLTVNGSFSRGDDNTVNLNGTLRVGGNFSMGNGGTFNSSGGTVEMFGIMSNTINCGDAAQHLGNLIINGGTKTILTNNCFVYDFTLTSGTFGNPATSRILYIHGDFTQGAGTALGGGNLTVSFSGSTGSSFTQNGGTFSSDLTIQKINGVFGLDTDAAIAGACNLTAGELHFNGNDLTCNSLTFGDSTAAVLFGNETVSPKPTIGEMTVYYNGDTDGQADTDDFEILPWDYHILDVFGNDPGDVFTAENFSVRYVSLRDGFFVAPAVMEVLDTFENQIGNQFQHNNGTVSLTGTGDHELYGDTTFYNLTRSATAGETFSFNAGDTFTFAGTLTLTGEEGELLVLQSTSPGDEWFINPQGTRVIEYVEVSDSHNINATPIAFFADNDYGDNLKGWLTSASVDPGSIPTSGSSRSSGSSAPTTVAQAVAGIHAWIQSLVAQLVAIGGTPPAGVESLFIPVSVPTDTPVRDLTLGSTGNTVTALQNLLIAQGYPIPLGATGYFGTQTRSALAAYQAENGIAPTAGYFGAITRAQMKVANLPGIWW